MLAYISYPNEFRAVAEALDSELRRRKIDTFYDRKEIIPGADWQDTIEININKAYVFVVLYSPEAANTSNYYLREIQLIQAVCERSSQRVLTVIFDQTTPSDLPEFFKQRQILVSETTGIIEDERDSYWIDQIVCEVGRNLNKAKLSHQMIKKKLFLASSSELKEDREQFEIFINRKNKDWIDRGVFLDLVIWEDYFDAVSQTRLQDEYNKAIRECDLFVMLFATKVGKYSEEEFETAFGQFKATNQPFIFTYFKDSEISTGSANKKDLMSLWAFQEKLDKLGHFYSLYKNIDELKFKFNKQLDKLTASGFIEFKPNNSRLAQNTTISISHSKNVVAGSAISANGNFVVGDSNNNK